MSTDPSPEARQLAGIVTEVIANPQVAQAVAAIELLKQDIAERKVELQRLIDELPNVILKATEGSSDER